MEKIHLTVETKIVDSEGSEDTIEFATEGKIISKNGKTYIYYNESEISGMEGCLTTLRIDDSETLIMKRYGSNSMELLFREGNTHEDNYRTPYGIFDIIAKTKKLQMEYDGNKSGSILVEYDLEVVGLVNSYNIIKIKFQ
ncbi:MAG: DUF1934 domain-containing protein [Firmicutes bacterium]|jgi:uncharacterized beta-barrel protein YwiB (DUF1934 family)|nr:DUF1934 domain-containing protein [Bacillota bacterium]